MSLARLWAQSSPDRFIVLTYHRVIDHDDPYLAAIARHDFAQQIEHVARYWQPVTAVAVIDYLTAGRSLPRAAVLVTFDDGYRDTLTHAWPILRAYKVPAMLFVTTSCATSGTHLWTDEVAQIVRRTRVKELGLEVAGERRLFGLADTASRLRALAALKRHLKLLENDLRVEAVRRLYADLEVCPADIGPASMLDWSEIARLAREGMTIGAHTVSHPILSRLSIDRAREEIEGSRREIERNLGVAPTAFCYPNGRQADFTDDTKRLVREAGFRVAFADEPGVNGRESDPYDLSRIGTYPRRVDLFSARLIVARGDASVRRESRPAIDGAPPTAVSEGKNVTVDRIAGAPDLEAVKEEWGRLVDEAGPVSFFLTFPWINSWWKHYGRSSQLYLLFVRRAGRTVGAAPFYLTVSPFLHVPGVRQLRFLGDGFDVASDHIDVLAVPGEESVVVSGIASYLRASRDWDLLNLRALAEGTRTASLLRAEIAARGLNAEWDREVTSCPYVLLPGTWDEYERGLHRNMRQNLRRRRKKLELEYRVRHVSYEAPEQVDEGLAILAELHARSKAKQGKASKFASVRYRDFHREVAQEAARRGWLHLSCLLVDGRPASMRYGFVYDNRLFSYQTGFDTDLSQLSVLQLHLGQVIERSIGAGLCEVDLLRGAEPHKFDWTPRQRINRALLAWNQTTTGTLVRASMRLKTLRDRLANVVADISARADGVAAAGSGGYGDS